MDNNPGNLHHMRATTRAGMFPPPPPLFSPVLSPIRLSFDSVAPGEMDTPTIDSSMSSITTSGARTIPGSAMGSSFTSVTRQPSIHAGGNSSELPSLMNDIDFGVLVDTSVSGEGNEDQGWTPVTCKINITWT